MSGGGAARVQCVLAAASQMAEGAELLLDVAPAPTPDGADGPTEADAALLGVLLALADQAIDQQQRREADGLAHLHEAAGGVHESRGGRA